MIYTNVGMQVLMCIHVCAHTHFPEEFTEASHSVRNLPHLFKSRVHLSYSLQAISVNISNQNNIKLNYCISIPEITRMVKYLYILVIKLL